MMTFVGDNYVVPTRDGTIMRELVLSLEGDHVTCVSQSVGGVCPKQTVYWVLTTKQTIQRGGGNLQSVWMEWTRSPSIRLEAYTRCIWSDHSKHAKELHAGGGSETNAPSDWPRVKVNIWSTKHKPIITNCSLSSWVKSISFLTMKMALYNNLT